MSNPLSDVAAEHSGGQKGELSRTVLRKSTHVTQSLRDVLCENISSENDETRSRECQRHIRGIEGKRSHIVCVIRCFLISAIILGYGRY